MRMAYLVLGNACYIVLGILCNADAIFGTYNKKGCHYCFYHDQGGCHSCYLFFGTIGRLIFLLFIVSSEVYLDSEVTNSQSYYNPIYVGRMVQAGVISSPVYNAC